MSQTISDLKAGLNNIKQKIENLHSQVIVVISAIATDDDDDDFSVGYEMDSPSSGHVHHLSAQIDKLCEQKREIEKSLRGHGVKIETDDGY